MSMDIIKEHHEFRSTYKTRNGLREGQYNEWYYYVRQLYLQAS